MAKIGFDIDDVLHDFVWNLIPHLNKHTWKNIWLKEVEIWIMDDLWEIDTPLFGKIIKDSWIYVDNPFHSWIGDVFKNLIKDWHEIHLLTSRYEYDDFDTKLYTEKWLTKHDIQYTSLTITNEKGKIAKSLWLDYHIDDSIWNIYKIYRDSDTKPFILSRPWNWNKEIDRLYDTWAYDGSILEKIKSDTVYVHNVFDFIKMIK